MTSATDKTLKTCLNADVIEMIFLPLFKEVDESAQTKARGKFDDNCGKTK